MQTTSMSKMSVGQQMMARSTDDGQTNQKMDDGQTIQKIMRQSKKICSLENISFLGTTSCTTLYRLLQVESAYGKTPVEHILQKYSSCTFT